MIEGEIRLQILEICSFEPVDSGSHAGEMTRGVAVWGRELIGVPLRKRALAIEKKLLRCGIVGERIKIAAKRLRVAERAPRSAEIFASALDTDGLHEPSFCRSKMDLKRRRAYIDVTATFTRSAMIE